MILGLSAPAIAIAGAILAYSRLLDGFVGFRLLFAGVLLGLLSVLVAIVATFLTRGGRNPPARRRMLVGVSTTILYFAALLGFALPTAGLPLINDITTDTEDPPAFVALAEVAANRGRDMSYDSTFAAQQRAGYPTLGPKVVDRDPEDVFRVAERALVGLPGLEVVDASPRDLRIEATVTSSIFHFTDDVVVRIRPHDRGAIVDVRSKSRVGKGDLGANAARIEALFLALR